MDTNTDFVDRIIGEAEQTWPEYDSSAMAVTLRVVRAFHFIVAVLEHAHARFGLDRGRFGVLLELRLAGVPYRLTPTQLYNRLLVTSGSITARVDRLEARGLVRRVRVADDRRSVLVELTGSGFNLINDAMREQHLMEQHLLEGIDHEEREQLAGTLRKLLVSVEAHSRDCCEICQ